MNHKGYLGTVRFDDEAGVLRGRVVNTRDTITFQGRTVDEVRQAFRDSVDDYLEFCAERGESPDKPFSGRFIVRTKPELHRDLAIEAQHRGVSVNALVNRALTKVVRVSSRRAAAKEAPTPKRQPSMKKARVKATAGR